jgi:hypothetical protein
MTKLKRIWLKWTARSKRDLLITINNMPGYSPWTRKPPSVRDLTTNFLH